VDINSLYKKAVKGDSCSETELFRRLTVSFSVILQHKVWNSGDREEVLQNAMLTVAQKYRNTTIESSFAGWACSVLNNKVMDYVKRKKVRSGTVSGEAMLDSQAAPCDSDPVLKTKLLGCLKKVGGANARFARILNLHYHGFTTDEICGKLDITRNHFYVILSRARSMLAQCLAKGDIE
jgi:RNA polymerase sigma factor (sigma-70 family)